jgi:putative ATPase
MKELGNGHEYRYAHDEPNAYAAGETYLPDGIKEPSWYQPVPRGLEIKMGEMFIDCEVRTKKGGSDNRVGTVGVA